MIETYKLDFPDEVVRLELDYESSSVHIQYLDLEGRIKYGISDCMIPDAKERFLQKKLEYDRKFNQILYGNPDALRRYDL